MCPPCYPASLAMAQQTVQKTALRIGTVMTEKLGKQYNKAQQSTNSLTIPNTAWHKLAKHVYSSQVALRIQINPARTFYSAHVALLI